MIKYQDMAKLLIWGVILALLILLAFAKTSNGEIPKDIVYSRDGNCTFTWEPVETPFTVGYYLYVTDVISNDGFKFDVGNKTTFVIQNCAESQFDVYVTVYDFFRKESKPSKAIRYIKSYGTNFELPPPQNLQGIGFKQ